VELPPGDQAAAELLRQLAAGRSPQPALRRLVVDALQAPPDAPTPLDNARAGAAWMTATPAERGAALHDLLLLADALPSGARLERDRFPRLNRLAA
jgi:hypothetical protein